MCPSFMTLEQLSVVGKCTGSVARLPRLRFVLYLLQAVGLGQFAYLLCASVSQSMIWE